MAPWNLTRGYRLERGRIHRTHGLHREYFRPSGTALRLRWDVAALGSTTMLTRVADAGKICVYHARVRQFVIGTPAAFASAIARIEAAAHLARAVDVFRRK